MAVVSVSMPEQLIDRIDGYADEHDYRGRSEVLRDAARDLFGEFEDMDLEGHQLMAVVTVLFDYGAEPVERRMMQLRHEYDALVQSNVHNHVGDQYCTELFVLDGSLEDISTFVGKIRATQDTLSVDYSVMPVDQVGTVR